MLRLGPVVAAISLVGILSLSQMVRSFGRSLFSRMVFDAKGERDPPQTAAKPGQSIMAQVLVDIENGGTETTPLAGRPIMMFSAGSQPRSGQYLPFRARRHAPRRMRRASKRWP